MFGRAWYWEWIWIVIYEERWIMRVVMQGIVSMVVGLEVSRFSGGILYMWRG